MGRCDCDLKKCKNYNEIKFKEKYKTEFIIRNRTTDNSIYNNYNTTPTDKFTSRNQPYLQYKNPVDQYNYLRNNLIIKSGVENQDSRYPKKISIRNYTPKILNQEINMGMWI